MGATTSVSFDDQTGVYPVMAFVAFQAVFAIITVALISGAIADRAKFSTWMIFTVIWGTLVYFPIAHWVFDFSSGDHKGGWIANTLKAIDFAGGTAVHINAGVAGRLEARSDAPAQLDAGHDRCWLAVVRMVRFQCRICNRCRHHCRNSLCEHHGRDRCGIAGLAAHGAHP
jgi:hypothetical protein